MHLFLNVEFRKWAWAQHFQQLACALSEDSDQPAHSRRLIRVFTVHLNTLWSPGCQTSALKRLIRQRIITKTRLFKYIENFTSKNWNFSGKKLWYFSYFCSKHRLWVLVRTASARRFYRIPTIYVLSKNMKNNVYPCKPQFYHIKVGFKGVKIIEACFRNALRKHAYSNNTENFPIKKRKFSDEKFWYFFTFLLKT